MPGYGLDPYGLSIYGAGTGETPMTVVGAVAVSRRQVQVGFSQAPLALSGFGKVDVLNPTKWTVTVVQGGAVLPVGAVRVLDTLTVELYLLEPLENYATVHRVQVLDVEGASGAPIGTPSAVTFPGISDAGDDESGQPARPIPVDLLALPDGQENFGTTLVIGPGGDYDTEQGDELLSKLIIRRLTTPHGSFLHLPDYGVGLLQPKSLYSPADLRRYKAEIERQVELEPEVAEAQASIVADPANGVLSLTVKASTVTGKTVAVKLNLPVAKVKL